MEADEAGTLATLRRCRAAMATLMERHDGRIVNTWGDAVIAEFASVVEAVQCAVETQQEALRLQRRAARTATDEIPHPGSIYGDVMVEGDDIYGDGVNITATTAGTGRAKGILISGPVYDQVHNKLSIGFDCLGRSSSSEERRQPGEPAIASFKAAAASRPTASAARCEKRVPLHLHLPRIARRPASSLAPGNGTSPAASSQRRDDRHRRLLVCDQRVQRPQGHLVSSGPPRYCC